MLTERLAERSLRLTATEERGVAEAVAAAGCGDGDGDGALGAASARVFVRESSPSKLMSRTVAPPPSCVVLDAAACVLCLPQRDGVWPIEFDARETGGAGRLEVVAVTAFERIRRHFALAPAPALCDAAAADSGMLLRLLRRCGDARAPKQRTV